MYSVNSHIPSLRRCLVPGILPRSERAGSGFRSHVEDPGDDEGARRAAGPFVTLGDVSRLQEPQA
ncbi:hypothetical protein PACID_07250 [Acidipropionibacterium acidipropionici ATCC 4875]|uniref:Uncharacterized protein n=1 Tax=Acidipropionibacterium acidipropionici (strain ATCC 4875 / DSM 20272 / JCM 6432 / NBRC 12425 / NCIMB 8070 / 4) TaxID=1171373 RepID=K7RUE3_ACIA4|nr:hypothetical protein PACID_07250 [Acidipropionibacterium acidipropionici ATCC 4875]